MAAPVEVDPTFLFSDIEGSTRLWEAHPVSMRRALIRHDEILRKAVETRGGSVFKHTGDGMCAVFSRARHAVEAAVAAQLELGREDWGDVERLVVRMGIHSGPAQRRDHDYFGRNLNRVARLMSAAHGGQIILTGATRRRMNTEDTGLGFLDLGEHLLPDLAEPEHIFQVVGPGLPTDFPSLRLTDAATSNLPAELSTFVGRTGDLEELGEAIGRHRLVTLTGTGGAGKTRLALHLAADRHDEFDHGVWLVELGPVEGPADVVAAVAGVFGIGPRPGEDLIDTLATALHSKQALILLDNCEHVVDAAATVAGRLLDRCPRLRIVATSRERLGLPGEWVHQVTVMTPPPEDASPADLQESDAALLFLDRARAAVPGFAVTEETAALVARICRSLDGIPLAIELAAARLRVMNLREIAAHLDDRFRLLTGGGRTATSHHHALRATIEWSYDLLHPNEARLFERMAMFVGGAELDAIEQVCGPGLDGDVLDGVASLVDKSLVATRTGGDESTRYWMLETIRHFGRLRLADRGEEPATRLAHARFYVDLAAASRGTLSGPEAGEAMRRWDDEIANVRLAVDALLAAGNGAAVLEVAGGLKLYLMARQALTAEARSWIASALAVAGDAAQEVLARALSTAGALGWADGDLDDAAASQQRALAIARDIGDTWGEFAALYDLGLVAMDRGAVAEAREVIEQAVTIARAEGHPARIAQAVGLLGAVAERPDQIALLRESLDLHRAAGRTAGVAHVLLMLGWASYLSGDLDTAAQRFAESRDLWRRAGDAGSTALARCGLAEVACNRGDTPEALDTLDRALEEATSEEWPEGAATVRYRAGAVHLAAGDGAAAAEQLDAALDAWPGTRPHPGRAATLLHLARIALGSGDLDRAAGLVDQSRVIWDALDRIDGLAWAAAVDAGIAADRTGPLGAMDGYRRALALFEEARKRPMVLDGLMSPEAGGPGVITDTLAGLAAALRSAGDRTGATRIETDIAAGDPSALVRLSRVYAASRTHEVRRAPGAAPPRGG